MSHILRTAILGALGVALSTTILPAAEILPGAKKVLFLGDSITYDGRYVAWVAAWIAAHEPARKIEVINCGLPSETVSGLSEDGHAGGKFPRPCLFERLDRVLMGVKPDVVIACYGINDGIYLPWDADRAKKYQDGIQDLRKKATDIHAQFIVLTPPVFDSHGPDKNDYNGVMDRYSAWLMEQRTKGWQIIDLHSAMAAYLADHRKTNPAFTMSPDKIHPNDEGHWVMAKAVLAGLGADNVKEAATPEAAMAGVKDPAAFLKLVQQRSNLLRDAWLTSTKHTRPGIAAGLPMDQAEKKADELSKGILEAIK